MCPEGYNHQAVVDFETNIISIHMPMRGTTNTRSGRRPLPHFNPRAHEGHDPREVYDRLAATDFNPRAHEGHDFILLVLMLTRQLFQSTCPRGARHTVFSPFSFCGISIHVPTRGTTEVMM